MMPLDRLKEIRETLEDFGIAYIGEANPLELYIKDVADLLADRDALAAELDDWRSGKLRLAPLKAAAAATNTHKEDLRDKFKDPEIVT